MCHDLLDRARTGKQRNLAGQRIDARRLEPMCYTDGTDRLTRPKTVVHKHLPVQAVIQRTELHQPQRKATRLDVADPRAEIGMARRRRSRPTCCATSNSTTSPASPIASS